MANPYKVVAEFEETIASWAGAKYGVAVESCSAALFLSCLYCKVDEVTIPHKTYPSVPCAIIHAGGRVRFEKNDFKGIYQLKPYPIWDGALRFKPKMYGGGFHCLSFHMKKHLPIGRGGMILTDDHDAYVWLKRARFDGRDEIPMHKDNLTMLGWNMYMEPSQAIRGLQLFSTIDQRGLEDLNTQRQRYPDLRKYPIYRQ